MIRNVIFDMGGVLIRWSGEMLMDKLGLNKEDSGVLYRELFREWEWMARDAGEISEEEAYESVCKRVDEHLYPAVRFFISEWWTMPFLEMPGIEDLVRELYEKGYKLYVLSNADINQKKYFKDIPGYRYFSGRVTSAEIRMLKPEREIFEYICREYDLKKEECFFIDDSNLNAYCAKRFGMNSCVFHDTESLRKSLKEAGVDLD